MLKSVMEHIPETTLAPLHISNGIWPVVLTPFANNGQIDWTGYGHLLDWYTANGVDGFFLVCLSSEMYFLTERERLDLATYAVRHLAGTGLPTVACAGFGVARDEKIASIKQMADTGVDAVVLPLCQVVPKEASEVQLIEELEWMISQLPGITLGIYECPVPYHRLLSPEFFRTRVARQTAFLKDTCCDIEMIKKRLSYSADSHLKLFNANSTTLLDSLRSGAAGYSGIAANYYPPLLKQLFLTFAVDPRQAEHLQMLLDVMQRHVDFKYPRGAKLFLQMNDVPITDYCRTPGEPFTSEQYRQLQAFAEFVRETTTDVLHP